MKFFLTFFIFLSLSCRSGRAVRVYDSSYVKRDTSSLQIILDTISGRIDSIRTYKSHVQTRNSPKWYKLEGNIWYVAAVFIAAVFVIIIKR